MTQPPIPVEPVTEMPILSSPHMRLNRVHGHSHSLAPNIAQMLHFNPTTQNRRQTPLGPPHTPARETRGSPAEQKPTARHPGPAYDNHVNEGTVYAAGNADHEDQGTPVLYATSSQQWQGDAGYGPSSQLQRDPPLRDTRAAHGRQQINANSFGGSPWENPADSYLERVEHNPRLQEMLHGAPTRTFHTSIGQAERLASRHMPSRPSTKHNDFSDKPLPDPRRTSVTTDRDLQRAQSSVHSRHRPLTQGTDSKYQRSMSQIPDGDRYPVFPRATTGHSRQSSRDFAFPRMPSTAAGTERKSRPSSTTAHRSRLAGGLRSDLDLGEPELGRIEEDENRQQHESEVSVH